MAEVRGYIIAGGKLVVSALAFSAANELSGGNAPALIPAMTGAVTGNYLQQYLNEILDYTRLKEILRREHPSDLNHDLEKLLKGAGLIAIKHIKTLFTDYLKEKKAGYKSNDDKIKSINRVKKYFDKKIAELKYQLEAIRLSNDLEEDAAKINTELTNFFFKDISENSEEEIWKDLKQIFDKKFPDLFKLSFYESLKKDTVGMRAFTIVMLTEFKDNLQKVAKGVELVKILQESTIKELRDAEDKQAARYKRLKRTVKNMTVALKKELDYFKQELGRAISAEGFRFDEFYREFLKLKAEILHQVYPEPKLVFDYTRRYKNKMNFKSRYSKFKGRAKETDELLNFCNSPQSLEWFMIIGDGGTGKSRLAMEFCFDLGNKWNAGFLDNNDIQNFRFEKWVARKNTFIVIDYISRYPQRVIEMLESLYDNLEIQKHKIRFLLIERDINGSWWDQFKYAQNQSIPLIWKKDIYQLPRLERTDLGKLMESVFEQEGKPKPPVSMLLKILADVDKKERPLFAMLIAFELIENYKFDKWTTETLLENYLLREEYFIWSKLAAKPGKLKKHIRIAIVATLTGGMTQLEIKSFSNKINKQLLESICGIHKENNVEQFGPLEPDIVGEFFVVYYLFNSRLEIYPFEIDAIELIQNAWNIRPRKVADFVWRYLKDFPQSKFIEQLTPVFSINVSKEAKLHWCETIVAGLEFYENCDPPALKFIESQFTKLANMALKENDQDINQYFLTAIPIMAYHYATQFKTEDSLLLISGFEQIAISLSNRDMIKKLGRLYEKVISFYFNNYSQEEAIIVLKQLQKSAEKDKSNKLKLLAANLSNNAAEFEKALPLMSHAKEKMKEYNENARMSEKERQDFFKASSFTCYYHVMRKEFEKAEPLYGIMLKLYVYNKNDSKELLILLSVWDLLIKSAAGSAFAKRAIRDYQQLTVNAKHSYICTRLKPVIYEYIEKLVKKGEINLTEDELSHFENSCSLTGNDILTASMWSVIQVLFVYYLHKFDVEKALYYFEKIKAMKNLPKDFQDGPVLIQCSKELSSYYLRRSDQKLQIKYRKLAEKYAEEYGINIQAANLLYDWEDNNYHIGK